MTTPEVKTYSWSELMNLLELDVASVHFDRPSMRPVDSIVLPIGSRNNAIASIAGALRRQGLGPEQLKAILGTMNEVATQEPLGDDEVNQIAESISRYEPANPASVLGTLTDTGNGDRFVKRWGSTVRYVPEWRTWLIWDGSRWLNDDVQLIMERAKTVAREIHHEAASVPDHNVQRVLTRHALTSQKIERLNAMVRLASSVPEAVIRASELDKDNFLLGVKNGVLELRTGRLRDADPEDYLTRQSPVAYDANAECPVFVDFLTAITDGNLEIVEYMQRIMGYCLTGETSEQCLFFFYGSGANGKTTLLNVIKELMGPDYCKQTPAESLMVKARGGGASNDIARLEGVRVTLSNEIEEGSRLAESLVKSMTGSDPVVARMLYREFNEFVPRFKLIIAGNHQPVIRGDDHGIWRRLHLVPFPVTIPPEKRDHKLSEKLRAELPGILNFALKGCVTWQKNGLNPPKLIADAVAEYRSEMDILGQWIEERCILGPEHEVVAATAYMNYKAWASGNGFQALSSNSFGRRLKERFPKKKKKDGTYYIGITSKYRGIELHE